MIKIIVKGWNNGRPNNETGTGYGIRIKRKDIDRYFEEEWTSIIIELEGEGEIEVSLSNSFWRCCTEIRKKEIGKWMIKKGYAPWPKGHPPAFELVPISNRRFRLHSIKPSRKD